jgi:hypothetical protein
MQTSSLDLNGSVETRMKSLIPVIAAAVGTFLIASPAIAGTLPTPLPVAGGGLLALAGMGVGYRMLKRRFDR